jgi:hypothetical protein
MDADCANERHGATVELAAGRSPDARAPLVARLE